MRKLGIDVIDEAPWGTHLCHFHQTKEDLLDILVPYFKAGLENNEFCMWITSEPLNVEEARDALARAVNDFDDYLKTGQIEILDYRQWYLDASGEFKSKRVLQRWVEKENQALKKGFDGLRLTGNTFWLEKENWQDFTNYEEEVNKVIGTYRMVVICTYSLNRCSASEVIDMVNNHQCALISKGNRWTVLES